LRINKNTAKYNAASSYLVNYFVESFKCIITQIVSSSELYIVLTVGELNLYPRKTMR